MKRSAVNPGHRWAKDYLHKNNIHLPEYAYWPLETWKANVDKLDTVRKVMLGWDITDYGLNDFEHIGSVRSPCATAASTTKTSACPSAEKYIIMRDGQRLTNHYHVAKTEDIINPAPAACLRLYLWNVDPATGKMTDTDVNASTWTACCTPSSRAKKCWWSRATASR